MTLTERLAVELGIGGDFPIEPSGLWDHDNTSLFSSGRDALAAIARIQSGQAAVWLVPDFICHVVPNTLRTCGVLIEPYRWLTPWTVDNDYLANALPRASAVIVPFYMGLSPKPDIWRILAQRPVCVVEDRCQCVGAAPDPAELCGDYAIGSFRKWMAVPDGAYCVSRDGPAPRPARSENREMVRLRLAAALVKQTRLTSLPTELDQVLEGIAVELFRLGEDQAGAPREGRQASQFAESVIRCTDYADISARRIRNQRWLAERLATKTSLKIWEPECGWLVQSTVPLLALPVLCARRDILRQRLAAARVFCAVHWEDADWAKTGGHAAAWAASTLSLPIDQRYEAADLERIVEAVE